jgi:hypothetical protein
MNIGNIHHVISKGCAMALTTCYPNDLIQIADSAPHWLSGLRAEERMFRVQTCTNL